MMRPRWRRAHDTRAVVAEGPWTLMADRKDLEFTYSLIDRMFRLSLGELADFSGAKYDGDFSLSLEEAQQRKHDFVAEQVGSDPGGKSWTSGAAGARCSTSCVTAAGTASASHCRPREVAACHRHGLDARLFDARQLTPDTFGQFDAVVSLGAFEHFCSPDDQAGGRQDAVYADLFARTADVLPDHGRFYLQTMVFGANMIPLDDVDLDVRPGSPTPGTSRCSAASSPGRCSRSGPSRSCAAPRPISGSCRAPRGASTTSRPSVSGAPGSRRRASRNRCSSCG